MKANGLTSKLNKLSFSIKKHSPEILIVAGVIGTITSTVMACRATTKISEILEDTQEKIDTIHNATPGTIEDVECSDVYTIEDSKKELTIVYTQTAWKLIKLYAPSISLGALSIVSLVTSNRILRNRCLALTAAYTAMDKSYKEYRNRVEDRFGKDVEHEIRYNIKAQKMEERVVDEDGKEKKIKKTIDVANLDGYSDYAVVFDKNTSYHWEESRDYNLAFIYSQLTMANDYLQAKGHMFLNDVYKALGLPETREGQIIGWVYDSNNPLGDNYIDFGTYDSCYDADGNPIIILDFNPDGNILSSI